MAPFTLKGCAKSVHLGAQMQLQGGKRNYLMIATVLRKTKTRCPKISKSPGYANVSKKSSKLRPPSKGKPPCWVGAKIIYFRRFLKTFVFSGISHFRSTWCLFCTWQWPYFKILDPRLVAAFGHPNEHFWRTLSERMVPFYFKFL